jgi:predicted unusual protein kinase regulating ubiquinone biosynthesis (AarF/ABC1/UbiB family)
MHWSLLREMVCNELGDDPENLFASFEKRAFAAASLGQVHGAQLRSGEAAAVKIQYPGIARTVAEDFRNLALFLLPGRLGKDWAHIQAAMEDLRARLEKETDYQAEAVTLARARSLFRDADGILVPRVYPQLSSARVLTMERLPGLHLDQFLRANPSQEQRNEAARKIFRAWYRLLYAGRMVYVDFHPGNLLFLDDGRLGLIDFGFMVELDDEMWGLFQRMDRALTTGNRDDRIAAMKEWSWITDDAVDADFLRLAEEFADCCWRPRYCGGEFDFGDEADFRRSIDLFLQMASKRYARMRPCTPAINRQQFAWRSIFYRLRAKIDVGAIATEEVKATGWNRSGYAPC